MRPSAHAAKGNNLPIFERRFPWLGAHGATRPTLLSRGFSKFGGIDLGIVLDLDEFHGELKRLATRANRYFELLRILHPFNGLVTLDDSRARHLPLLALVFGVLSQRQAAFDTKPEFLFAGGRGFGFQNIGLLRSEEAVLGPASLGKTGRPPKAPQAQVLSHLRGAHKRWPTGLVPRFRSS